MVKVGKVGQELKSQEELVLCNPTAFSSNNNRIWQKPRCCVLTTASLCLNPLIHYTELLWAAYN